MVTLLRDGDEIVIRVGQSWLDKLLSAFVPWIVVYFASSHAFRSLARLESDEAFRDMAWAFSTPALIFCGVTIVVALWAFSRFLNNERREWRLSDDGVSLCILSRMGKKTQHWPGTEISAIVLKRQRDEIVYEYSVELKLRSGGAIQLPWVSLEERDELARDLETMFPAAKIVWSRSEKGR